MASIYNTKQRDVIIEIFEKKCTNRVVTITEFLKILSDEGINISKATIYRRFKMLEDDHILRVFIGDDGEKLYELIQDNECLNHIHLACKKCYRTFHMDCEDVAYFIKHIETKHEFLVDKQQTIIYGICKECR